MVAYPLLINHQMTRILLVCFILRISILILLLTWSSDTLSRIAISLSRYPNTSSGMMVRSRAESFTEQLDIYILRLSELPGRERPGCGNIIKSDVTIGARS